MISHKTPMRLPFEHQAFSQPSQAAGYEWAAPLFELERRADCSAAPDNLRAPRPRSPGPRLSLAFLISASLLMSAACAPSSDSTDNLEKTSSLEPSGTPAGAARQPCKDDKLAEIREEASNARPSAFIDCDLTLRPDLFIEDRVITKRLILEGSEASSVTVDCNGAKLDGGRDTLNYRNDMIEIKSRSYQQGDGEKRQRRWEPVRDVVVRDCEVIGSVRIWGMAKNGEGTQYKGDGEVIDVPTPVGDLQVGTNYYKISSRTVGHTAKARANAPARITLENLTITGVGRNPLYFAPGVTLSKLLNSEIEGISDEVAIYLDAESSGNVIKDNQIHVETGDDPFKPSRPQIAIDGSSNNTIINNSFSGLDHGGIYLYRNCGLNGVIRHEPPAYNTIVNNIFFYRSYKGLNPAVYLGSRDGGGFVFGSSNPIFGYCDDDEGYLDVGSSQSDKDHARNNVVIQNQFYARRIYKPGVFPPLQDATLDDMVRSKDWESNSPNFVEHNELVTDDTVVEDRRAGCYNAIFYGEDFVAHDQTVSLFEDTMGRPHTTLLSYTCNDGIGSFASSKSERRVERREFECQVTGNSDGCAETASCRSGKQIVGAIAACNLESGTVSDADVAQVRGNIIRVIRASDDVSDGSCRVGSKSLRRGEGMIGRFNGSDETTIGCKEHDKNGGDCHIKGILYCY